MKEYMNVGDTIEFDFFGEIRTGFIEQVADHGYWVKDGSGSVRCPFEKANELVGCIIIKEET